MTALAGAARRPPARALALLGVLGFSITLPATRLAGNGGLDPLVLSVGRAVPAALGALACVAGGRAPRPAGGADWWRLLIVGAGVVVGFPLLTAAALHHVDATRGAVVVGMLPAATALAAAALHRAHVQRAVWAGTAVALLVTLIYMSVDGGGAVALLELLGAVALAGLGYAQGGELARRFTGPGVICWALIACLPLTLPATAWTVAAHGLHATASGWLAFAYVSAVSMFLAFFAWYAALGAGDIAWLGQLQLVQPLLTLGWSGVLLGEWPAAPTLATAAIVLLAGLPAQRRPRREVPLPR